MAAAGKTPDQSSDPSPSRLWWAYELTMAALALVVAGLLTVPDEGWARMTNLTIWAIFVADYGTRIALADDRRRFLRGHVLELVSILPLDFLRVARVARLARLTRLLRAGTVLWRVTTDLRGVLGTNGLGHVLVATTGLVVGGGLAAWAVEGELDSVGDGVWWALVTATTVGYGDISPVSTHGRVIAATLMFVGIGTLGMITGSIATYFLGHDRDDPTNPQVEWIRDQLARWDDLGVEEQRRLAAMLTGLATATNGTAGADEHAAVAREAAAQGARGA